MSGSVSINNDSFDSILANGSLKFIFAVLSSIISTVAETFPNTTVLVILGQDCLPRSSITHFKSFESTIVPS